MVEREIKTIMHKIKVRTLIVKEMKMLNPNMKQITFMGDDLKDFVSPSPDDHVKLFFPYPDEEIAQVPDFTQESKNVSGRPPLMRDYTPRWFDNQKQELKIDFFLHQNGIGTSWARQAKVGAKLLMAGPRGSRIVPYDFNGYLLVGDESFLPSVARRLEELPTNVPIEVILIVASEENHIDLPERENLKVHWVHFPMAGKGLYEAAIKRAKITSGDWFAWVGCERECAFAVRDALVRHYGFDESRVLAKAYWTRNQ